MVASINNTYLTKWPFTNEFMLIKVLIFMLFNDS